MFAQRQDRRGEAKDHFSYNCYICTDLSFRIMEEHNKNKVAGSVLGP